MVRRFWLWAVVPLVLVFTGLISPPVAAEEPLADTFAPLAETEAAPANFAEMWDALDPRAEPLEVEVLKEWEEDDVVLRVVRFRVGIFKGERAKLAGVYGFPKGKENLPGLLQIHGGGQYADARACLANARRGYATLSIAWAGRISSSKYSVNPDGVKRFWENRTDHPEYRVTTDWGAVDGYHAPSRNPGNQFPSIAPADWTFDAIESPRNSGWFLSAVGARRALTFLEQQPEVDPQRLGVYGHSMGGKLTVLTAPDPRVKAAAPSCGGISDRDNASELFRKTLGDDVSLRRITCPIFFLSPANDFHGRIGDLPDAVAEIKSDDWRVTCSPHHNHQDTPSHEVATLLWFDDHLRNDFSTPATPETTLTLNPRDGVPVLTVTPDRSLPIRSINVYSTRQGQPNETRFDRVRTMNRFWRHHPATVSGDHWTATVPVLDTDSPLWVYANVTYKLPKPITGAGYYYGSYTAETFVLSSILKQISPGELKTAGVTPTLKRTNLIESFEGDWEREWFTYRPAEWGRSTHKLFDPQYRAPAGARLVLDVQAETANRLVLRIDDHVTEVAVTGGAGWQTVRLSPNDFRNYAGEPLPDWEEIKRFTFSKAERLRPGRGQSGQQKIVGGNWRGTPPRFRNLRWDTPSPKIDQN